MARARKPVNEKFEKEKRDRVVRQFAARKSFTTTTRKPAAGPTSAAIKVGDPALRALIDEALAKRESP